MHAALSQLMVNTRLVGALEDRAYREGLLTDEDTIEVDFIERGAKPPAFERENATLDLVMLYDTIVGSGGSMRPNALDERLGGGILQARAPMVRRASLAVQEVGDAYQERAFSRHELGS
ncbi:MAG TPA: hypothetical protein VLZ73_01725, partial [Brevundimonas sp.]|nr:hypothetical protein [Brevundimonas sp.]